MRFCLCFLWILLASTVAVTGQDGSLSDDQVLQAINQGRDEEQRVRADGLKIVRPEEMPGVTLVGYSTGKGSHLLGTVFIGDKPHAPRAAAQVWLASAGWDEAAADERLTLAKRWVDLVMMGFGDRLVEVDPGGFGGSAPEFTAPVGRVTGDGGVVLVGWIQEASTTVKGKMYRRTLYQFGSDGSLARVKMLERHHVPE